MCSAAQIIPTPATHGEIQHFRLKIVDTGLFISRVGISVYEKWGRLEKGMRNGEKGMRNGEEELEHWQL